MEQKRFAKHFCARQHHLPHTCNSPHGCVPLCVYVLVERYAMFIVPLAEALIIIEVSIAYSHPNYVSNIG